MRVTATVELIGVVDRKLQFRVAAHDQAGLIGEGMHERFIIDVAKFMGRVERRAG
jgi:fluoroacetyl-CoA thioesterase